MIKLTHADGRPLWMAKDSIIMIMPAPLGEWRAEAKTVINGSFAVMETPEHILEMLKCSIPAQS